MVCSEDYTAVQLQALHIILIFERWKFNGTVDIVFNYIEKMRYNSMQMVSVTLILRLPC